MRCFNCGAVLTENDFCTNCGEDVRIYRRIMRLSNMYYNDGLNKAQVRDLSGAVESLRQSLKCNRNNIEARNLLGLVYYEMGEAVAALSEWVISKNLKPEKNVADDFLSDVQGNPTRLSGINQSLKKYNQALSYCYQESFDLAIIQLKKVLQMNPNLIVAYQLLGLLYLKNGDYPRARRTLERGIKIDKNNTQLLSYLQEAKSAIEESEAVAVGSSRKSGHKTRASSESIVYKSGNETIIQPLNTPEKSGSSAFLNILIGLGVGMALMWFLVLPARVRTAGNSAQEEIQKVSNELTEKSADIDELNKQIASLTQDNTDLNATVEKLSGGDGLAEKYDILFKAALNYVQNPEDVINTADMLKSLSNEATEGDDAAGLEYSEAFTALYDFLKGDVFAKAAAEYKDKGMEAYNSEEYQTAVDNLNPAFELDPTDDSVLYYLASAYRSMEDSDKATELYSQLVNNFPDSEFVEQARGYLRNGAVDETAANNNGNGNGNAEAAGAADAAAALPDINALPQENTATQDAAADALQEALNAQ